MPDSVEKQLETLPAMARADLALLWQKLFHSVPDPKIRNPAMIRFLAYRIQEQAYGSLSATSERRLRQLEAAVAGNLNLKTSSAPKVGRDAAGSMTLAMRGGVSKPARCESGGPMVRTVCHPLWECAIGRLGHPPLLYAIPVN